MRIARELGGFTLGEADILRKAMGKKNAEVMQKQRARFVEGAKKRKVNEKKAARTFDLMEHFAGYGFPKAHSTTYALLAYQTAFLKANHPLHFAAALLTIEAQNTDKLATYLSECRERGIPLLPPDINESSLAFTVTPEGVRFGLTAIKNVGEGAIQSLLDVRGKQGRIKSLHSLCEELDLRLVNKRVFESLIKAGAFDSLRTAARMRLPSCRPRCGRVFWRPSTPRVNTAHGTSGTPRKGRRSSSAPSLPSRAVRTIRTVPTPPFREPHPGPMPSSWPLRRRPSACTGAGIRWIDTPPISKALGARALGELGEPGAGAASANGGAPAGESDVSVGGIVATIRPLKTRKGERMAVFMLEDAQGSVEVIAFPETFQKSAALIEPGTMVLVRGKLERGDESVRMLATEIVPLDQVKERFAREVAIRVSMPAERSLFEALGEVFSRHRGDRRVSFEIVLPRDQQSLRVRAAVSAHIRVRPSSTFVAEVEHIVGPGSVSLR